DGATDEPVWLPNDAEATNVYGENGFINLGENLLDAVIITPKGISAGKSYSVPSYLINAKGEYGQKDSQHPEQKEQNPRVLEYHSTTQNPETGKPYTSDEIAWCASFTNWNITQVGLPSNENKYNATATSYNKWNSQYTQLKKPAVGALAVINNSHVTFVIGVNGKNIHGFGGNQSNQVKVSTYFNPGNVRYYVPVGITPNYNVPTINYNFNNVKNESTR
ncbi:MAG: TIGR02594 family protein, partial [Bacteroidales bacterium]|nr:TIGR02594 family protein [Bacteroidales bacterium]